MWTHRSKDQSSPYPCLGQPHKNIHPSQRWTTEDNPFSIKLIINKDDLAGLKNQCGIPIFKSQNHPIMKRYASILTLLANLLLSLLSVQAQQQSDNGLKSISEGMLRNHIFFLASNYMNGRVATSPEYTIASQYVASQFAAAGLKPLVMKNGATNGYFQGLPFAHTTYNDQPELILRQNGHETRLVHNLDYKVGSGSPCDFDTLQLVFVGYGIDEPAENWNELKDLDLKGKIAVCLNGAPTKDGQPVLSEAVTKKYSGWNGLISRSFGSMVYSKGVAGIILVNPEGTLEMTFDELQSDFTGEKFRYLGAGTPKPERQRPFVYVAKPGFLDLVLPGNKGNKPQILDGIRLSNHVRIIKEDTIYSNNVIGMVPGTDSLLRDEYIIVGGHLDHIGGGNDAYNGADDNASGSAGVMEIARAFAMNPCKRTIVFAAWTSEEMGMYGSEFFLKSGIIPKEKIKFNLNLDMIGRTGKGNEASRAHYVVTDKKYVKEITAFIEGINKGITDFPILFDNDDNSPGGSDHMTFIEAGIPAFFFFSGVHADLHNTGDDPEKIDYPKAASICRLGYLVTERLGNIQVVPTFEPPVDPSIKQLSAEPLWVIKSKVYWSMVHNGMVLYVSTEGEAGTDTKNSLLHAVDLSNGKELWNKKLSSNISTVPFVERNIIYYRANTPNEPGGTLFGIDLNSRQIVFEYVFDNVLYEFRVHNNILFGREQKLIAIDIGTKKVIWKFGTESTVVTEFDFDGDNIYVKFTSPSGPNQDKTVQNLCALKIRSGEKLWEYQIDQTYSNPRVYGNLVCFWSRDRYLCGINKVDGQMKWRFNVENEFRVATAQSGNHIYVVSGKKSELYCLDSKQGNPVWTFSPSSLVFKEPIFYKSQVILFSGKEKSVIGLDNSTGRQLWELALPVEPGMNSTIHSDCLFIHCADGFYCYDLSILK